MQRWFSLGPHSLSDDEKTGRVSMGRLDGQTPATDLLTMALATGFERVRKAMEDLVAGGWTR